MDMKYADSLKLIAGLLLAANAALFGAKLTDRPAAPTPAPVAEEGGLRVLGPAPLELPRQCLAWQNFAYGDYPALRDWLGQQEGQHEIRLARASGWWAWLAETGNGKRETVGATATLRRLQAAGFADALIVRGGKLRGALALGVFESEAGACARRDEAVQAGFSAACGPRPLPLTGGATLVLEGGDAELSNALMAAFPKAKLTAAECPAGDKP